jgi:hypothetical protein
MPRILKKVPMSWTWTKKFLNGKINLRHFEHDFFYEEKKILYLKADVYI